MKLHPQVIEKEGNNKFVILPFEEYQVLEALALDYEDALDLKVAKERAKGEKSVPLKQAVADLDV